MNLIHKLKRWLARNKAWEASGNLEDGFKRYMDYAHANTLMDDAKEWVKRIKVPNLNLYEPFKLYNPDGSECMLLSQEDKQTIAREVEEQLFTVKHALTNPGPAMDRGSIPHAGLQNSGESPGDLPFLGQLVDKQGKPLEFKLSEKER